MARVPSKPNPAAPPTKEPPDDGFQEAIRKAVSDLVTSRQADQIVERVTTIAYSEMFSGPLPHPKHLAEYAQIIPDGPNRIMAMAEKNLEHHSSMQRTGLQAEVAERRLGLWLGAGCFSLLVLGALAAVYLEAHASVPIAFLGAAALGGVGVLVNGRQGKK